MKKIWNFQKSEMCQKNKFVESEIFDKKSVKSEKNEKWMKNSKKCEKMMKKKW